ncbi:MAG: Uma2 family endonuclease [Thermoanaerobaculia bacterium]
MAEPVRKMPADLETASPDADPFRYGWRPRYVRLPDGEVIVEEIPLTAEDLLDPQDGDVVGQSEYHFFLLILLADLLRRYYTDQKDVFVAGDLKMLWRIPGLKNPAPDIAVIPGVRDRTADRKSFDVVAEGTRPCLVIELVSSTDEKTRSNDYDKKVEIYERARIPEYFILDPPTSYTQGRFLISGFRLGPDGRYRPIAPDSQGRILSETTGLLFAPPIDGCAVQVFEAATGTPLLSSVEESEARKAAERRAEAERRRAEAASQRAEAAEAELARLRAEIERLGR